MNNTNNGAKTFAQIEKAVELAEHANKHQYNWDELAEYFTGWEPQSVAENLLFIYFEFTRYYLEDKGVCGSYDKLCNAAHELRCLYEVISQMDKEPGHLKFTADVNVTPKQ